MMQEILNNLSSDIVFRSYLNNSFILNQMNSYMEEIEECKRERDEVEKDMDQLIRNIQMMMPYNIVEPGKKIDRYEFMTMVDKVKNESITNLIERRKN